MSNATNRPAYQSKAGPLELVTWVNEHPDGNVTPLSYLTRSYLLAEDKRDGDEDTGWRKTQGLRKQDLLVGAEMLRQAYVRLCLLEVFDRLNTKES